MSKTIPLTNSKQVAIVDNKHYKKVREHKWYKATCKKKNSSHTYVRSCGPPKIFLHRFILGLKVGDGKIVDHIDFDGLNNVESNLRICTVGQNSQHRRNQLHSSKYKGVTKVNYWSANIQYGGKQISLGRFASEKEAALAYNKAAKKYFGEFAVLNHV